MQTQESPVVLAEVRSLTLSLYSKELIKCSLKIVCVLFFNFKFTFLLIICMVNKLAQVVATLDSYDIVIT